MNPKRLTIEYDESRDILTVNGIHYSGFLFRVFAGDEEGVGFQLHKPITMVDRKDGTITLSRYDGGWWAWKALWEDIWRFIKRNAGKW